MDSKSTPLTGSNADDSCEARIAAAVEDLAKTNVVTPKMSEIAFIVSEILKYMLLLVVIYLVIFFTSNQLQSEAILDEFVNSKITSSSASELGWTVIVIFVIAAVINLGKDKMKLPGMAADFIDDFLLEIPRAIYLFGATSSMCAYVVYFHHASKHHAMPDGSDPQSFLQIALILGFGFLVVGLALNRLLSSKLIR